MSDVHSIGRRDWHRTSDLYPVSRLAAVREATAAAGLDALLLTPGPDLRYVTGYEALPLERLTCLVVPAAGEAFLMVPRLELPAARGTRPASRLGIEFVPWDETDDPYAHRRRAAGPGRARSGWPTACGRCRRCASATRCPPPSRCSPAACCASCGCARAPAEVGRAARGGRRDRRRARPGARISCGPAGPSARSAGTSPRRSSRPGTDGRLRHRRLGAQRRQPAPRAVRPGHPGGRARRGRHRRPDAQRLLLRLHPHLLRRRAAGRLRRRTTRCCAAPRRPPAPPYGRACRASRSTPPRAS